jgi:hypothetical protein
MLPNHIRHLKKRQKALNVKHALNPRRFKVATIISRSNSQSKCTPYFHPLGEDSIQFYIAMSRVVATFREEHHGCWPFKDFVLVEAEV